MKFKEFKHTPVQPDTYEASMALNQLMRIGKHAIKLHNMIDDAAEMESWVAKKIDLAGDYVKKVYNYTEGEKAGLYDDGGMTEDAGDQEKMQGLLQWFKNKYDTYRKDFIDDQIENGIRGSQLEQAVENNDELVELENIIDALKSGSMKDAIEEINNAKYEFSGIPGDGDDFMQVIEKLGIPKDTFYFTKDESLEARLEAKLSENTDKQAMAKEIAKMYDDAYEYINDSSGNPSDIESDYKFGYNDDDSMEAEDLAAAFRQDYDRGMALQKQLQAQRQKEGREGDWDPFNPESMYHAELKALMSKAKGESVSEDAGEGHMSKSTLYHTAKYAIALMDMIKPGDDLEGWVQSKLNKAADYLQGVYNYEEYQKLNPYREELDASLMQKHAKVVQKNIDEILSKETKLDDIDTKPGMMRILAKRVNEVEKEIAKETRKKTNEDGHTDVPSAIRNCETIIEDAMQMKQKLQTMEGELPSWMTQMIAVAASDLNDARDYLLNPTTESGILYRAGVKKYGKKGMRAIQSAAGKGASHQEIGKIKDKHLKDEEDLDESIKDWAKNLAAAGVIVGAVAGMGSIQNAIDNTVPAVKAMNTAYEMAVDSGNSELAKNIKNDISAVKVRLDSGKDLDFVKAMQDKYSKFIQTEGLTYESQLALALNQRLK